MSVHVGWRMGVDSMRYLAAREARVSDAVAALRRQPDAADRRRRSTSGRAGRPRPRLRRDEFPRLLRHVRRQRLLPRLRE